MKILHSTDFKHVQLSSKDGEKYSLSSLVSEGLGSKQLFIHHDKIPPFTKASGLHRHTDIEEVVYVVSGSLKVKFGDDNFDLKEGGFVIFSPNETKLHQVVNDTDQVAVTVSFSIRSEKDKVEFS